MDSLLSPFAPPPSVRALRPLNGGRSDLSEKLVETIAARLGLTSQVVVLGRTVDTLLGAIGREQSLRASNANAMLVSSPDMNTGQLLSVTEAVRMARSSELLIIDERAGGFAHRDHLPLFREFQNVVLIRSFDMWIKPAGGRLSYLLTKSPLREHPDAPDSISMQMALATFADGFWMQAATRQTARERVRLARALRKLNMVRPIHSAAGFVAASVERGDRSSMRAFLEDRGIVLHYPDGEDVADLVRISAVSAQATSKLSVALIDWALTLDS